MITKARMYRLGMDISLKDFTENVGCHESQISNFEHGRLAIPEKWKEPLARELGVKVSDIMDKRGLALWMEAKDNPCAATQGQRS